MPEIGNLDETNENLRGPPVNEDGSPDVMQTPPCRGADSDDINAGRIDSSSAAKQDAADEPAFFQHLEIRNSQKKAAGAERKVVPTVDMSRVQ